MSDLPKCSWAVQGNTTCGTGSPRPRAHELPDPLRRHLVVAPARTRAIGATTATARSMNFSFISIIFNLIF